MFPAESAVKTSIQVWLSDDWLLVTANKSKRDIPTTDSSSMWWCTLQTNPPPPLPNTSCLNDSYPTPLMLNLRSPHCPPPPPSHQINQPDIDLFAGHEESNRRWPIDVSLLHCSCMRTTPFSLLMCVVFFLLNEVLPSVDPHRHTQMTKDAVTLLAWRALHIRLNDAKESRLHGRPRCPAESLQLKKKNK